MLKIRMQGTKEDIECFQKILMNQEKLTVHEFSDMYANKGTNKYFRAYAEIENKIKSGR